MKFLPVLYEFEFSDCRLCIVALWWPTFFKKQVKIGCCTLSFDRNLEVQSLIQCNWIEYISSMSGIIVNFESKREISSAYGREKNNNKQIILVFEVYGFFSAITEIAAYMKRWFLYFDFIRSW